MAGELQPLNEKFPIVGSDGRPTIYFIEWAQQRQIDITDAITADQALVIIAAYIADHPTQWGTIDGVLSDQTDLQAALDAKLTVFDDAANWSPGALRITAPQFSAGDNAIEGTVTFVKGFTSGGDDYSGQVTFDLPGFIGGAWIGQVTGGGRVQMFRYGTVTGWEFDVTPFVGANAIFHEGNLAFGTGLDYTAGVLTATGGGGGGGVLPVVDGSIPPVFLQNPDGSLIYTPI